MQISKIAMTAGMLAASASAVAADKPNILAIFGDDIGIWNVGAYNQGMMATTRQTSTVSQTKVRYSPITMVNNLVLRAVQPLSQVKNLSVLVF
ncbi:arylsulfatase [Vibrio sp. JCM 19236]|nr:arylsulfatase [Vibrio sp. JCM 19236]